MDLFPSTPTRNSARRLGCHAGPGSSPFKDTNPKPPVRSDLPGANVAAARSAVVRLAATARLAGVAFETFFAVLPVPGLVATVAEYHPRVLLGALLRDVVQQGLDYQADPPARRAPLATWPVKPRPSLPATRTPAKLPRPVLPFVHDLRTDVREALSGLPDHGDVPGGRRRHLPGVRVADVSDRRGPAGSLSGCELGAWRHPGTSSLRRDLRARRSPSWAAPGAVLRYLISTGCPGVVVPPPQVVADPPTDLVGKAWLTKRPDTRRHPISWPGCRRDTCIDGGRCFPWPTSL